MPCLIRDATDDFHIDKSVDPSNKILKILLILSNKEKQISIYRDINKRKQLILTI